MRKHSFIQSTENKFTGSLMFRRQSLVIHLVALILEETDYNYSDNPLTMKIVGTVRQTGMLVVPSTELRVTPRAITRSLERVTNRRMMTRGSPV
jgi:hypothetical protein